MRPTINDLFPESGRVLLTGGGREFLERIGVEATRRVVLSVLMGENVRTLTEPLTRRRLTRVSGAMVTLFLRGWAEVDRFTEQISGMALEQINGSRRNDNASMWLAQWLIGLTGKSVQNVLRSDPNALDAYLADFEAALAESVAQCQAEMGPLQMTLGFLENGQGERTPLGWKEVLRLTTAIGSLTLTLRGSDKSIYGKLFERLVLGSVLTLLGFQYVRRETNTRTERVFWLSDSSDVRECDATLLLQPGRLVRFDIGFIGPGNSEISKDKLTRYANEREHHGAAFTSKTFIIVDRLPDTSRTQQAAERIGAEIVQMSMQYWPRDLAARLERHLNHPFEILDVPEDQIHDYLTRRMASIPLQDFLSDLPSNDGNDNTEVDTEATQ